MKKYGYMRLKLFLTVCLLLLSSISAYSDGSLKREFRGAWIQCVNGQFLGMGTRQMQDVLSSQLDILKDCGVNAIIFQVRPECDALYNSPYEPWSRFLTGKQGQAPSPYWDPLEWMDQSLSCQDQDYDGAFAQAHRNKTSRVGICL